ncbi:MAG: DUF2931 family protein [Halobacteriovoraceae bacterium]|nr:DUF2931 family protein [Halobacteriovoraceae bacterium]
MNKFVLYFDLFLSFISIGNASTYEWRPTESALKKFPMKIVKGHLYYPNGKSIYIPSKSIIDNGWGEVGSVHVVGEDKKPVPNKLEILWFSFTENQFYEGTFELPYEKLKKMFKEGIPNEKDTYPYFVVGVAPGGGLSLWLAGSGNVVEVANFKAKKVDQNWSVVVKNKKISRLEYIKIMLEDSLGMEGLENLNKNGVPKDYFDKIIQKRRCKLNVIGASPVKISTKLFNGESMSFEDLTPLESSSDRGILKEIKFEFNIC